MDTKQKFKITLSLEGNRETKLWSGTCTQEEYDRKLDEEIKVQLSKYNADHKRRILRAYDETGRIIAHETF